MPPLQVPHDLSFLYQEQSGPCFFENSEVLTQVPVLKRQVQSRDLLSLPLSLLAHGATRDMNTPASGTTVRQEEDARVENEVNSTSLNGSFLEGGVAEGS